MSLAFLFIILSRFCRRTKMPLKMVSLMHGTHEFAGCIHNIWSLALNINQYHLVLVMSTPLLPLMLLLLYMSHISPQFHQHTQSDDIQGFHGLRTHMILHCCRLTEYAIKIRICSFLSHLVPFLLPAKQDKHSTTRTKLTQCQVQICYALFWRKKSSLDLCQVLVIFFS